MVLLSTAEGRQRAIWYLVAVPIGEELLFRGWIYKIYETIAGQKPMTATNPLAVSIWMSAFCFSLWHSQNIVVEGWAFGLFQIFYTFFVGLWLGLLRERSGGLLGPVAAHILLNIFGSLLQ